MYHCFCIGLIEAVVGVKEKCTVLPKFPGINSEQLA